VDVSKAKGEGFLLFDRWQRVQAEQAALEARAIADAKADQSAVWALADLYLPSDIREFGARHKIPELSEHIWRSAFVAGWRAANRAKPDDGGKS
jgi:hypothetical protein